MEPAQPSRQDSRRWILFPSVIRKPNHRKDNFCAPTRCAAKPFTNGRVDPAPTESEKTGMFVQRRKSRFSLRYFPGFCRTKNPVFHSVSGFCWAKKSCFSLRSRLLSGKKSHLHITLPAPAKRWNLLSLVGAGSTRPLLRNPHNHPGGFPRRICFSYRSFSDPGNS